MENVTNTGKISADSNKVWGIISAFSGLENYLPPIASSTTDGDGVGMTRTLTTQDGGQFTERLEALDAASRTLKYSIISDHPFPFSDYVSTIKVSDAGNNQCEVEWSAEFNPNGATTEEVQALLSGLYDAGFSGLESAANT